MKGKKNNEPSRGGRSECNARGVTLTDPIGKNLRVSRVKIGTEKVKKRLFRREEKRDVKQGLVSQRALSVMGGADGTRPKNWAVLWQCHCGGEKKGKGGNFRENEGSRETWGGKYVDENLRYLAIMGDEGHMPPAREEFRGREVWWERGVRRQPRSGEQIS